MLFLLFFNLISFQFIKCQKSTFKIFAGKDVGSNFPKDYLIYNSKKKEETDCLFICNQNNMCSTALYKQNKECQLFNKLAEDGDLKASSGNDVFVKYPRSCKQIKRFNSQSKNGLYGIDTPNGKIQVFCEFESDTEGFTFLPRESLDIADDNFLKDIYLNQSVFLTKFLFLNNENQSYVFVQQLDLYTNQSIIISINKGVRHYTSTSEKFFKISLVNESEIGQVNKTSGFKANGHPLTYTPCGTYFQRARYFIFYQTLLNSSSTENDEGLFLGLIQNGIDTKSKTLCPKSFFYTIEYHMADCGGIALSNQNKDHQAYAFAFGLK